MPQFKVTGPDGKSYRVNTPKGASQQDAIAYVAQTYYGNGMGAPAAPAAPAEAPQEGPGFFESIGKGVVTPSEVLQAGKYAVGNEEAAAELAKPEEGGAEFGFDKTLGENWDAFKQMAGQSLGFLAAPAAAGAAGTLAGGPVVGAGAAIATLLTEYTTENLGRQAQEDAAREQRGEAKIGPAPGRALTAAVFQTGLDVAEALVPIFRPITEFFPFARPLLGIAGKEAAGQAAKELAEAAAKNQLTIKGGIARGVIKGAAVEVPQELAQTVLERAQAGLDLGSDEAINEYKQATVGSVLLGGAFGGAGGGIEAYRGQSAQGEEERKEELAASVEPSTSEEKAEFERLLTEAVTGYVNTNPGIDVQSALKALRDDGTIRSLGQQARANVEKAQEGGLGGAGSRPDVDVAGAAGPSVSDTGVTPTAEEGAQGAAPVEPVRVAGAGEPAGGVAAPEAGAVGALTPEGETQAAEEFYPDLMPAYTAETSKAKMDAVRPVVSDIFARVTGLDLSNPKALPENVQKALNTSIQKVHTAVKGAKPKVIDPEAVVQEQLTAFGVTPAAEAAPETQATPEATPTAPAYTYADLIAEADSLVASNPDLVLPGQLTAQQFQQFSIQAEQMPVLAEQGVEVPSAVELRQDLYKLAGREAPPLAGETTAEPVAAEPAAAEEYDPDTLAAATEQAPSVWAALSKQVKGKPPAAWDALDEEAQDNFIGAIAAAPGGLTVREFAKAIRPTFDAIRTGKPVPQAAPAPAPTPIPEVAPAPEPQVTVEAEPAPKAGGAGKPPKPPKTPRGKGAAPAGGAPKKPRVITINKAKMQWAMREAGLLRRRDDAFRKKLLRSKNAQELNENVGSMFFGTRDYQGPMNLLRLLRDSLSPQAKRLLLPLLPTDDIARMVGDRLNNIPRINKLIDDLTVYRNKRHEKTSVIQNKWMKFMTAFPKGADILDTLMKLADFHDVDVTAAPTPDAYAKIDPEMKRLIKEKASKAKRDNRQEQIDSVYLERSKLMRRENGDGAGMEIFKLAKEAYRRNLVDSYILTINRISEAGLSPENQKLAVSRIKFMFKDALSRRVYFPAMRYGRHWFSVGTGKNIEYYMFESALQRNLAFAQRQREMKAENDLRDMDKGDDYKEIREHLTTGRDASAALKDVFEKLDSGTLADTTELKDTIFQMYLLALPEGDMRKRFSHRRYVTGFGMDSLRDFVASQNRAASQLARLSYAHQVKIALSALSDEIKKRPDRVDMEPYVKEISERAKAEVDPPLRGGFYAWLDKFASLGNKFVFLWMLTAPKSALIQATQLHTVGLPVLSDEFGFGKVMKTAGRYTTDILLGNKLALHRKDANGDVVTEFDVNMRGSKFMKDLAKSDPKKHKLLLEAYDYADQRGTFASTFINDLNETASRPSRQTGVVAALKRGRVLSAATQGSQAAMQFMSVAFHQMENLNRQIMYMTSFELAYDQAKAKGMSDTAAKEAAMEKALKVTRETMFNYSNYNKPRAFKSPIGRIATQFMTYPVMMTSYLVRNFKGILPFLNPEGKMSAAKRLFGTLGMTGMYAGLTGLPLYSVIFMAMEAAREMLRDDDDFAPYEDDKDNPVGKVDLKYWFENSWLPETFGPDSSLAKALGLSPELAVLLERSAKFGPISALSDMNIASSTSLDSLYFRGDVKADTLEGQFKEMIYNQLMGPLGGLVGNMTRGARLYEEGETTRAMELMLPAFVKGAVRASRLQEEGLKTIDGKVLKDADFFTDAKLFSQALGFGSTETYEMQKQNIEGNQIVQEILDERNKILQKVKQAELRVIDNPSEANEKALTRVSKELDAFNNRFPLSSVDLESIGKALGSALEEQAGSVGGAEYNPEVPVMEDVIARRTARGQ